MWSPGLKAHSVVIVRQATTHLEGVALTQNEHREEDSEEWHHGLRVERVKMKIKHSLTDCEDKQACLLTGQHKGSVCISCSELDNVSKVN